MKHILIIALITLVTAAWSVEVDLTDVELSPKSAEALAKFETAMQKESEAYLKKVTTLRNKYVKQMKSDAKKQRDIKVVMKIESTIKELEDKKPVDLFGQEIVKDGGDFVLVVDSKSKIGTKIKSVKKGQKVYINYVSGEWQGGINPNNDSSRPKLTCQLRSGGDILSDIPTNTKSKPFIWTATEDLDMIYLCNGDIGPREDNNGKVTYTVKVK